MFLALALDLGPSQVSRIARWLSGGPNQVGILWVMHLRARIHSFAVVLGSVKKNLEIVVLDFALAPEAADQIDLNTKHKYD